MKLIKPRSPWNFRYTRLAIVFGEMFSVTEYEQPPLASAPETCKSVSPLCFLRDFALNASRKNAFQKDKPVTAPEAPMHFHAPGKMSFSDCAMFEQRNPTYPLEMTVFIRLYL